jgi:cephalosporin-C deacetylase-like acetyl esterase
MRREVSAVRLRAAVAVFAAAFSGIAGAQDFTVFKSPGETPRRQLTDHLNAIGLGYLRERDAAMARIQTREAMERRKPEVREKILRLLGGLPERRGPLNVQQIETLDRGGYRIEKIVFDSLPGFHVTANVYVPGGGAGPFPAILMPAGHWQGGKEGEREVAIGLARKGFVVLKHDPLGQGERLQYYDPDLRRSKAGGATMEHDIANGHAMLIGDNVARYRIWDGMRGIDYLVSRKDVDGARIGVTGCSGGGTLTTYISALDERVKAAAPACYITSWQELLPGPGPQDSEQSLPGFLSQGLNIADYIELFAPKPWLNLNTIQDFFPLEGARQTVQEARRIYALYGAEDKLGWSIGHGGHGVPLESREAVYGWFIKWLKDGKGDPREQPAVLDPPENLLCTKTGQVSDSLGGETVFTLNRKRAADLIPPRQPLDSSAHVERLRARLRQDIRSVAAITVQPGGAPPAVTVHSTAGRDGYRLEVVSYPSAKGIRIPGLLLVPDSEGRKRAVVVLDARPKQTVAAPGGDLDDLARAGFLVLAIQPSGVAEEGAETSLNSDHAMALRSEIVGRTLAGMRVEDTIRAIDYLASRPDADAGSIACFARGELGPVALHAAALDERIRRLVLEGSPALYRMAVDRPIHRHIHEMAPSGVLRKYDLDEVAAAIAPRPITVINPADALGEPIRVSEFRELWRYSLEARERLGEAKSIQVLHREREDRLAPLLAGQ